MNTVKDLLQAADPLRQEPVPDAAHVERIRKAMIQATAHRSRHTHARFRTPVIRMGGMALILVALAAGWRVWQGGAAVVEAAMRFEVRLAEDGPAEGLQEAPVAASGRVVYLHEEVILFNGDIVDSRPVQTDDPSRFGIAVVFGADSAERMRQATAGHVGRPIAILIDGEIVAAPVVRAPIGESAVISGDFTRDEAERVADGIRVP